MSELPLALTFDDVLLTPGESSVLPTDADTTGWLTRDITLKTPILSAAMDTVTESAMAITMAQVGGMGVIHRNLTPEEQALEISRVKKFEGGMVVHPVTVHPDQTLAAILEISETQGISGFPVVKDRELVGIVTRRDFQFETNKETKVSALMTPRDKLVVAQKGVSAEEAKKLLHDHRIEKLPIVDAHFNLHGLITIKDLGKAKQYPHASKDPLGRLRVGAAIGTGETALARAALLVEQEVDVIFIDTAHGHTQGVIETLKAFVKTFSKTPVIAGNVATEEGALALGKAGAHAVKVGMGPGSICTTRMVAGVGVPQWTAVQESAKGAAKSGIPLIADGGIKFSGDVVKALAAGASMVMIGSLFAGTEEAPGEVILYQGRSYKSYRGMGSLGAMQKGTSRDRYFQQYVPTQKLVPEGIEGRVPYRGKASDMLQQLTGGLRAGMGYVGASTIAELQRKARFIRISAQGLRESHVHDVIITQEAPNYRLE